MRPYQWLKNLLVFIPLLASHTFTDTQAVLNAIVAFVVFNLTASSVYIINDLYDREDDSLHPLKRLRPFASGQLSVKFGMLAWPVILFLGLLFSLMLSHEFKLWMLTYFTLAFFYSKKLKSIPVLDVILLSFFYTLRLIAGAAAVKVIPSFWLLTFSMFFFFSLAMMKRFNEVKSSGRKAYSLSDLNFIFGFGSIAGVLSVLVLALYIQDAHTMSLYHRPEFIWAACPVLLFWIARIWFQSSRGLVHEDPILFALKDKASLLLVPIILLIFSLAKYL